jgi:hypothetical protein
LLEADHLPEVRQDHVGKLYGHRRPATDGCQHHYGGRNRQKIESSINIKTTELPDGNSDWAMGEYDVGKSGEIKVTLSSYQPAIYARLVGSTAVDVTSEDFWAVEEEQTIPSSGTYAVVLNNTIKTGGTIVIADAAGSPFVSTGSGPASGQFTVAGASVTFNSADAGKEVLVTYQWVAPTATKVELPDASTRPQLYCVVSGEATDEDETTTYSADHRGQVQGHRRSQPAAPAA